MMMIRFVKSSIFNYANYFISHCVACSALSIPAALWCNCTTAQCEKTGYQCETDGACKASTSLIDGQEQHIRICITRDNLVPPGQPFYCLSAEGLLNTHCCYTDYCNSIDLKVPSGEKGEISQSKHSTIGTFSAAITKCLTFKKGVSLPGVLYHTSNIRSLQQTPGKNMFPISTQFCDSWFLGRHVSYGVLYNVQKYLAESMWREGSHTYSVDIFIKMVI